MCCRTGIAIQRGQRHTDMIINNDNFIISIINNPEVALGRHLLLQEMVEHLELILPL